MVGPVTFDPGRGAFSVTARAPHPGRGKMPATVSGAGETEIAALVDLHERLTGMPRPADDARLRDLLNRRLRQAFYQGAEEEATAAGRKLSQGELERAAAGIPATSEGPGHLTSSAGVDAGAHDGARGRGGFLKPLLVIALLVAGCSSSGAPVVALPTATPQPLAPWPEGWDTDFCYAIDQLGDAATHMAAATEAGTNYDLEGAAAEAKQAATDASEAADAIKAASIWPPAYSVVVYLGSAASEEQKAANLVKLGVENVDVSLVEEGVKHQEKATYQLGRAAAAADALTSTYGKPCD